MSPTDETREEGITPLLSVSFFLARPSTRPWDVFVQCAELCLSKKEVNFPFFFQYDISTQQFNGELFGKRLKLNFLAFDRLALWLNLI